MRLKCDFLVFYVRNIWPCQKKAVPLQPLLKKAQVAE